MNENIIAKGKLFELVQEIQPDGRVFEVARRAPGVRLIIHNDETKSILLTKEFRRELNSWDYRLPGGKVFDSLDEYEIFRSKGGPVESAAEKKVIEEGLQETGLVIREPVLFRKSTLGATVQWDLYVYEVTKWQTSQTGQQLEVGEQIEAGEWFSYDIVKRMILTGEMQEDRIALCLLQWIEIKGEKS
jgi:ADP-ribose pyrophosphatase